MLGANLLRGERVYLSTIEREHIPTLTRWYQNLDLQYLLFMQPVFPLSEQEETNWYEHITRDNSHQFSIYVLDTNALIGTCGLHGPDLRNRSSEVGISIGQPSYWDQGYGTDAMRVLLRYGFYEINLHRIELKVYSFNERAIRSYEKLGFQKEVVARQAIFRDGQYHDVITMGLLRSEWRDVRE